MQFEIHNNNAYFAAQIDLCHVTPSQRLVTRRRHATLRTGGSSHSHGRRLGRALGSPGERQPSVERVRQQQTHFFVSLLVIWNESASVFASRLSKSTSLLLRRTQR